MYNDVNDSMKDADEGTNFEDVQSASVKWRLANDSNNAELSKKASMEMIGHLSKENKEPYLKHTEPLQTYINAKDEYDYKNKNYTTTQNIDTTPNEKVRETQQKLNELGYTDKFGEPLKEDGVLGGKTQYAYDTYSTSNNRQPTKYESNNYYSDSEVNHYWIKKGIEQANQLGYYGHTSLSVELLFKILD